MTSTKDDVAAALGRTPSGLYILTAGRGGRSTGMLASWVQQAGFEPLMLTVAVRRDRYLAEWIAETGRFTLNQVAAGDKALLRHFGKGFGPEDAAFEGVKLHDDRPDGPILADAMAYLVAEVHGSIDGGDHRVFLARAVEGGRLNHDADPMIHVRKTAHHY